MMVDALVALLDRMSKITWRQYLFWLVVAGVADNLAARLADHIILSNRGYFEEQYDFDSVDWFGPRYQHCNFYRKFLIYRYKTCILVPGTNPGPGEQARFYYSRPLPIFSPIRIFPGTAYFYKELAWGEKLYSIKNNDQKEIIYLGD